MKIVLAGTGTSHGIPVIGCECEVCKSKDSRDNRNRTGAFVYGADGTTIIIDVSPEFRLQSLVYGLTRAHAVLLTHSHADHIHGLDDLRIFSHTWNPKKVKKDSEKKDPLKIYSNENTLKDIQNRFDYVFTPTIEGGGKPHLELVCSDKYTVTKPLTIGCLEVIPVPMQHGCLNASGWKITDTITKKSFAYMTDCNFISEVSIAIIKGVEHCVIDSLREKEHSTHFCFQDSLTYAKKIAAKNTWFTHISHDFSHIQIEEWIKKHTSEKEIIVAPSYDGLVLEC